MFIIFFTPENKIHKDWIFVFSTAVCSETEIVSLTYIVGAQSICAVTEWKKDRMNE